MGMQEKGKKSYFLIISLAITFDDAWFDIVDYTVCNMLTATIK